MASSKESLAAGAGAIPPLLKVLSDIACDSGLEVDAVKQQMRAAIGKFPEGAALGKEQKQGALKNIIVGHLKASSKDPKDPSAAPRVVEALSCYLELLGVRLVSEMGSGGFKALLKVASELLGSKSDEVSLARTPCVL